MRTLSRPPTYAAHVKTTTHTSVSVLPTAATRHPGTSCHLKSNVRQTSRKAPRTRRRSDTESRRRTLEEVAKIAIASSNAWLVVAFNRVERRPRATGRIPRTHTRTCVRERTRERRTAGGRVNIHPRWFLDRYVTVHHPLN